MLSVRLRGADGAYRHLELVADNRLSDPLIDGILLNMRDVSERLALLEQLRHQAFHDSLTGLPNRALFDERLAARSVRLRRSGGFAAVMFVDLDDFKTVNDGLGHAAGDELLRAIARRLEDTLRTQDTAARLGGDEFAVLLEDLVDEAEALAIAERVRRALRAAADRRRATRSRRRRASASPARARRTPPTSCCATPTSRCTRPRSAARRQVARLRGRHAPAGDRAPGAHGRARRGAGARRAGARLPADRRAARRRRRRLRGADPLAAPDAWAARARPLHRPGRVHRPDRRRSGRGSSTPRARSCAAGRTSTRRPRTSGSASTSPPASSPTASSPPW